MSFFEKLKYVVCLLGVVVCLGLCCSPAVCHAESFTEEQSGVPSWCAVRCFDVSEDGLVAVGVRVIEGCRVLVYSAEGEFLYSFVAETLGDFRIAWEDGNVLVYLVRSGVVKTYNHKGLLINREETTKVPRVGREKSVGEKTYEMRNDMGFINIFRVSYSRMVVTDASGTEQILYDANTEQLIITVIIVLGLFSLVFVVFLRVARLFEDKGIKRVFQIAPFVFCVAMVLFMWIFTVMKGEI